MKKYIVMTLIVLATTSLRSESINEFNQVKDSKLYLSYSFGFPSVAGINLAVRNQKGLHGSEFGGGALPIPGYTEVHLFGSYLYYSIPNLESQFYIGAVGRAGLAVLSGRLGGSVLYFSPGISVGMNWQNKNSKGRFLQLAVSPAIMTIYGTAPMGAINITHGFSF